MLNRIELLLRSGDMIDYYNSVKRFMMKHRQPIAAAPIIPPPEILEFRMDLIREEMKELELAVQAKNLIEIADALADLKYVIFGMDATCGIPADSIFDEVNRSNMTKDFIKHRGDAVKVGKGDNYSRPRIREIIEQAIRIHLG